MSRGRQTIAPQLNSQLQQSKKFEDKSFSTNKRNKDLPHQGIGFCNHKEFEGNLHQLLLTWNEDNDDIKSWIHENCFT